MSGTRRWGTVALVAAFGALTPAVASAENVAITSFDGTKIDADWQPATGLKPGQRAPTILLTHGFGATRETADGDTTSGDLGQVGAGVFRKHGFNTVTFDSRGFGRSGGEVQLDAPQFEGRDASAIVDWVANRPQAQLDGAGDPRVGMHGASYGGGVQWAAASRDRRIDALAPAISWTSLVQALGREGRLKLGWGLPLIGLGLPTATALGALSPHGLELGGFPLELTTLAAGAAVSGRADQGLNDFFAARSTGDAIANVKAPSLILQGTADTLFTPSQAVDMRRLLRKAGTPTKMLWFCGGHGLCQTGNALGEKIEPRVLAWMDRWLRDDAGADIGPGFEWVADDGVVRSANDFPLKDAGTITGRGAGTLPLTPISTLNGILVAARPAATGVDLPIPAQTAEREVVGEPVLRFRYRGNAVLTNAHVYAQIVDEERRVVVGNQATPIPVALDGQEHTVERSLEAVAMHLTPKSRYRLQITDGTNVYGLTTNVGSVDIADATVTLPVGDPAGTPADPVLAGSATRPGTGPGPGAGGGTAKPGARPSAGLGPATRRLRLAAVRRSGVLLRGTRPNARRVRVRITVSKATAKRLRLRSRVVATKSVARGKRSWTTRVRLRPATVKALRRRSATTLSVRVSAGKVRPARVIVRR
ncbi:alpha/beta fold hydrolase [Patulibacter americanus]|uniref:alpha/beta fold hydrolase n=1 Tax=Patulibacter americanus TaxID=588672 RepID=UPI000A07A328|nr:alpha/beta fold hydrolase [Patulibacter americanus]